MQVAIGSASLYNVQCWNFKQSTGARNRVGIGLSNRPANAGILEQSMGARNRVGTWLSYRPARLLRLAQSMGSLKVKKNGLWLHKPAESIPGLLKSFLKNTISGPQNGGDRAGGGGGVGPKDTTE